MPNKTPSYQRLMLLLPNPLAQFVDELAAPLSTPWKKASRQRAILEVLSKLRMEMTPPPAASPKPARKKVLAK